MKQIMIFLSVLVFASCGNKKNDGVRVNAESSMEEAVTVEACLSYTPQIWVNHFLSDERKDTLQVLLWSNRQQKYLDCIPVDTTIDWPAWYQQNSVDAILKLKGVEPLHIKQCSSLYYCDILREEGKRAIAIIPCITQWSNNNMCFIYYIQDNKWKQICHFSVLSSFTFSEDGEIPELTSQWLVKRDGKWMYRDYAMYVAEGDSTYHYVFPQRFVKN